MKINSKIIYVLILFIGCISLILFFHNHLMLDFMNTIRLSISIIFIVVGILGFTIFPESLVWKLNDIKIRVMKVNYDQYVKIQIDTGDEVIMHVNEFKGEEKEWEHWADYVEPYMEEGCKWLEIGCQTGYVIRYIDQLYDSCGYGIDINKNLIQAGTETANTKNLIHGDMHKMPYKEQFFDFLWAKDVLEHSYNPNLLLAECYRVLKDGAHMFAFLPLDGDTSQSKKEVIGKTYGNRAHTWKATSESCKERFIKTGFEIVRLDEMTFSELRGNYRNLGNNCLSLIAIKN